MRSEAKTVREYLASLPADRREAIEAIRAVVNANIDKAFEEGIQYGMPAWYLPHSKYPAGYHCDPKQPLPFASLASQKNHIGIYLFCIYGNEGHEKTFREEWLATGKKLDMGKACVRVKRLDDVPLEVVGRAFKRMSATKFVAHYEAALAASGTGQRRSKVATKKRPAKKTVAKKKAAKKTPSRRSSTRRSGT